MFGSWVFGLIEGLPFPFKAGFPRAVGEQLVTGEIEDFPLLSNLVELNVGGSGDFQTTDLLEVDRFGIKPGSSAIGGKMDDMRNGGGAHDCTSCWFEMM